jgi:hypothetical protein
MIILRCMDPCHGYVSALRFFFQSETCLCFTLFDFSRRWAHSVEAKQAGKCHWLEPADFLPVLTLLFREKDKTL